MKHKYYYWITLLAILGILATGCQTNIIEAQSDDTLTASGTIRAREIRIASELGGRVQEVIPGVGDQVKQGAVLVNLDATPLVLQLAPAEAAIQKAQADLDMVRAGARAEEIAAARAALELAEAQRDGALAAWENAQELVENPQEITASIIETQTQVDLAEQGIEMAEAQLAETELLRNLKEEGTTEREAADLQVLASQEALAAAEADHATAQATLNTLWGMRNEPLGFIAQANAAEGQYHIAESQVAVAQATLDDLLAGPTAGEIAVAEAAVRQAEAEANILRVKIQRSTLSSPIDGVVLDQMVLAGEIVAPSATILTLADLDEVTLDVYVPENRVGHVQVGQVVQVTVDSFPGKTFEGRVARINDEPEFTPRNVATVEERLNTFYAVEIQLANPDGLLKPGMPADATF